MEFQTFEYWNIGTFQRFKHSSIKWFIRLTNIISFIKTAEHLYSKTFQQIYIQLSEIEIFKLENKNPFHAFKHSNIHTFSTSKHPNISQFQTSETVKHSRLQKCAYFNDPTIQLSTFCKLKYLYIRAIGLKTFQNNQKLNIQIFLTIKY